MNFCKLCGEPLRGQEEEFHRLKAIHVPTATWEACLRAAAGDHARILRVHRKLVLDANPKNTLE